MSDQLINLTEAELTALAKDAGITEGQIVAYAQDKKMAGQDAAGIRDLTDRNAGLLVESWKTVQLFFAEGGES